MNYCLLSNSLKNMKKIKSKNKETIDVIREELKELSYELSKGQLK